MRFTAIPKCLYINTIYWLVHHLIGTRKEGYYIDPLSKRRLEVYINADISSNYNSIIPETDRDTTRSRHGYIIMNIDTPIV